MKYVECLTEKMIEYQIIRESDRKVYQYGLENGLIILINIITAVFIGCLSGKLSTIIIFLLSFISLRTYSGGYHLENKLVCYIFSNVILLLPLYGQRVYYQFTSHIIRQVIFVSVALLITFLCPVGCKKRTYDSVEKKHFRKRSIRILSFQVIIYILFVQIGNYSHAFTILASLLIITVLLLYGTINLKTR